MPTLPKAMQKVFDWLSTLVGLVFFLAIVALCFWQIFHGLKGGELVCPLYYQGSVIFSRQESPFSFWTVLAFYLAVGSTCAMILVKVLCKCARP